MSGDLASNIDTVLNDGELTTKLGNAIQGIVLSTAPTVVPVPVGNWTQYVKDFISGKDQVKYTIGTSGGGTSDPAIGCAKQFSTSYKCGKGSAKTMNITPDAKGQTVTFDCFDENRRCRGFRLTLGDDGNLKLTNTSDQIGTTLWQSSTYQTGLPVEKYKAANSKFKRNYLNSGETLSAGEFVGSPTGNCYLVMESGSNGTASLEIRYETLNCSETQGGNFGNDHNTVSIYTINKENPTNIGKTGYIDEDGILHQYPSELLEKNDKFYPVGWFSNDGNDISIKRNINKSDCQQMCKTNDECGGYVYKDGNMECQLKNRNIFPKSSRMVDESSELFIRGSNVLNSNSCSKIVNSIESSRWELLNVGDKMSMDTLCNLGAFTDEDKKGVERSNTTLMDSLNDLYRRLTGETKKSIRIHNDLDENRKRLETLMINQGKIKTDINDKKDKNRQNIALSQHTKIRLISENYNYMLWSILAISIIGYTINLNRS